jgi:glycosyltransferase involved in cell wall biosynthesis
VCCIIPARNEAGTIARTVEAVLAQRRSGVDLDVLVVDDDSTDATARLAFEAGSRVLTLQGATRGGNPAAARNRGARSPIAQDADVLIFLDADCVPQPGWLHALLATHARGATVAGGSLDVPRGMGPMARCDHYCGCYHLHPLRRGGEVPNHSPANCSVRGDAFRQTDGFVEQLPVADGHEELHWQHHLRRSGGTIVFEPAAVALHHNRPGLANLLRRSYRWGYSAIESKAQTDAARFAWLYRRPWLLIAAAPPFAAAHTLYTLGCWLRAGHIEPLLMLPFIFASRVAYAYGLASGGLAWLKRRDTPSAEGERPRWR